MWRYVTVPRYHFHLLNGQQLSDVKGIELPGHDAARVHAERLAQTHGPPFRAIRVTSEEGGEELFRVNVRERSK